MRYDFYATGPHYAEHLAPIWQALDPEERGIFVAHRIAAPELRRQGVDHMVGRITGGSRRPCVVASWADARDARHRVVFLVEHGVGQTYGDRHPSNPGGTKREHVGLFLCPNRRVAELNKAAYPGALAIVVGSPKMDRWHGAAAKDGDPGNSSPVVAFSWHWQNPQAPESKWALEHYQNRLPAIIAELQAEGIEVLGHGHPRHRRFFERLWHRLGVEFVPRFDDVLARADLYVCDNSSTLYEFASTGRPVLALNAPWYRREVRHGLRFWSHVPGLQCDEPGDVVPMVHEALQDPPHAVKTRHRAVHAAYAFVDGGASVRAVEAMRVAAMDQFPEEAPERWRRAATSGV